jgi:hypothetical protein
VTLDLADGHGAQAAVELTVAEQALRNSANKIKLRRRDGYSPTRSSCQI